MKKLLLLISISFISFHIFSQKVPTLSDKNEIIEAAKKEFETSMQEEGVLKLYATEHNIKGEYYFDITVGDKKRVVTVFAIGNDSDDIKAQNSLKDFLKAYEFSSFKVPKDKRYKYEQTFYFE